MELFGLGACEAFIPNLAHHDSRQQLARLIVMLRFYGSLNPALYIPRTPASNLKTVAVTWPVGGCRRFLFWGLFHHNFCQHLPFSSPTTTASLIRMPALHASPWPRLHTKKPAPQTRPQRRYRQLDSRRLSEIPFRRCIPNFATMLLNNQCEFDLAYTGTPVPTVRAVPETSPVGKMLEIFAHARFREMPSTTISRKSLQV